jgi:hypothetical protein
MSYHDQDDVIGFCGDMRHPYGCQDECANCGQTIRDGQAVVDTIPPVHTRCPGVSVLKQGQP